ncbi:MAG: hypothetical protein GY705_12555 [Bacteroidetes bacterium]|nr:hypothetical protein [Bacteroidota bacterium]
MGSLLLLKSVKIVGLTAIWIAFIWGTSCNHNAKISGLEAYYFPLEELEKGKVYEYRPINNDSFPLNFWHYHSVIEEDSRKLEGVFYNQEFIPQQFFREERVSNGMLLDEYRILVRDSLENQEQIPVEILSGSVFPFTLNDTNSVFLYHIKWTDIDKPDAFTTLIKNRRYKGKTSFFFKGVEYDCIEFEVKELIERYEEGYLEHEFMSTEIYAKGLGLVYNKKVINDVTTLEYELANIYNFEDVKEQFNDNRLFQN